MLLPTMSTIRLAVVLLSITVACYVLWATTRPAPPQSVVPKAPRMTDPGKSQDLLVGTSACAECHPENAAWWAESGHAHTFQRTKDSEIARQLDGRVFEDPGRGTKFFYHFDDDGLSVSIPSRFGEDRFPLTYALGSGTHGLTFLSLIPHEEGRTIGVEHRATFFRSKEGLGITPGQKGLPPPPQEVEHFGKIVVGRTLENCIRCHTTSGRIAREQIVGLEAHVGCERCHGPGLQHTQAVEENREDHLMHVKDRWPTAYAEIRTCGQCHRLPNMLKETELRRESVALVRLQPVGLLQSACYLKSEGRLRCTTCHDPHKSVAKNRGHYERICLECHTRPNSTNCPVNARTNCIKCHMPGIVLGFSIFHDHWIRVRNDADPASAQLESLQPAKK